MKSVPLVTALSLAAAPVAFQPAPGRVDVIIDGKLFTTFHYEESWDKPFLHPLRTPSGIVVSRGFPVEKIAGESEDHTWQRGIWYSGEISGVDFWRELGREKTGRLVVRGFPKVRAGSESGTLEAVVELVAPDQRKIGSLEQRLVFRRARDNYWIDLRITVRADQAQPLKFEDSEECCLGVRLADEFRQDRGAILRNSEGLVGTEKIWGKAARWVDYSATRLGRKAGVAVFDHPSNPRHPTYWHARGYGLNAANPVGLRSFTKDKSRDGRLLIPKGGSVTFHYRVVIHDGDADDAGIEKLYSAFAAEKVK